ncbi:MAG: flagellar biosynthesis protein FlhB [Oscillospiraceae bacterium]|nr:flagellar biosynthesis protein FlhB [Oscillospiraceae bacterium]
MGEKTEKATSKKRKDSRMKEGNVIQSKEITVLSTLFFLFFALSLLAPYMLRTWMESISKWLERMGDDITVNSEFLTETAVHIVSSIAMVILPLVVIAGAVPMLTVIVQTKGLITFQPLKPKFSKMNPINGAKKLVSIQSWVNVLKGMLELVLIGVVVYTRMMNLIPDIQRLNDMEVIQGLVFIAENGFGMVMSIVIVFAFVAVGDYIFQWWNYERKLKMSKQEVKDEYKNLEGDPLIKSKIKQKQREVAQQRMMEQVPTSDVVVRNPTHFAVALAYDTEKISSAPTVVAKGKDALALRIIDIAEEHEVYVTENRPLARELYDTVEVGMEIPPSLYNAIAIILSDMYTAKGMTINN